MPSPSTAAEPRHLVIAGMPRAGTTYLYHAFARHPGAFVPFRKELRFFSSNYRRGSEWYAQFFSDAATNLLRVDASPDYFMDPAAPARLRDYSPHFKVVLAVREPAAWSVSLHRQFATVERTVPRFGDFLSRAEYPDFRFSWGRRSPRLEFSLRTGFVQRQLSAFCSALGSRLLLYDFAFFEREPLAVLRALESFLDLGSHFTDDTLPSSRINARARKSNRLTGYLLSRDAVINAAGKIVPRSVLVALRLRADQSSVAGHGAASSADDVTDMAAAKSALASDSAYIQTLFSQSPLVLGNGQPFISPTTRGSSDSYS